MNLKIHAHTICHKSIGLLYRRKKIPLKYFFAMKLALFLIVAFSFQVSADAVAQKIELTINNGSLESVLKELGIQSGYSFIYNNKYLKQANPVSLNVKDKDIFETLPLVFDNQPFEYTIKDRIITVVPKRSQPNRKDIQILQNTIRGKVTDSLNNPLQNVTVYVVGTSQQAITNRDGLYEVSEVPQGTSLIFRLLGYETLDIQADRPVINVVLKFVRSFLDEPIVIGYGVTSRRLATGNVSKVSSETIAQQPVTNPLQALQGRVAGLQITQGNGLPGSPMIVQIRGRNSISANNNPLYIVDGVPFPSTSIGRISGPNGYNQDTASPMNTINPNDIESIEVLKDADVAAIYGSRAANGVILITTKKGRLGKTELDVNVRNGFGSITRTAEPLSTKQYLQLRQDAFANSGIEPTAANAPDLLLWEQQTDNNLQDWYMGNTANLLDASGTLSGGSQQTSFILRGNFHRETTIQSTLDSYKRSGMQLNIRHATLNNKLTLDLSTFYTSDHNRLQNGSVGALIGVAQLSPNYPLYDGNGNYNWVAGKTNFMAEAFGYHKTQNNTLSSNLNIVYNIFEGLIIKGNLGYNRLQSQQIRPLPSDSQNPNLTNSLGSSAFANQFTEGLIFEPQLNYNQDIENLKLNFLVGSTIQQNNTNGSTIGVINYTNDILLENPSAGTISNLTSNTLQYRYISLFARATLNYDDRYILNSSLRRDGTTRFGPNNQFGNFGSIGVAWLFSNEKLVQNHLPWLSFGKVRSSYGSTGSDGIGDYQYLSLYSYLADYGTSKSLIPNRIANPYFQWEVNKKLEVALDLGFMQDRIVTNIAWYRNRSDNQLVTYPLPATTGFSGYTANLPAVVENTGWEFELNTSNLLTPTFNWTTSFNLTIPRNRLVSFPNIESTGYANSLIVGESLNVIQRLRFLGIDTQTGMALIDDVNNDGNITFRSSFNGQNGDYIIAGDTDPHWFAGFNNSFRYKSLQLDVMFQYVKQEGYNIYAQWFSRFGHMENYWTTHLDYWKNPGDNSTLPKPTTTTNPAKTQFASSDRTISDASFLRLKNISLSYNFPTTFVNKARLAKLNIYIQGQNLWTVTDYIGYDPELATNPSILIPPLKMLTAGIQCTF